jgi:lipopolysaccharide/colanic/teichoic acid biosynthesis glycosyltransferase
MALPRVYKMYKKYLKRPMDFIVSLSALLILSPILAALALSVRFKLGSPVIF